VELARFAEARQACLSDLTYTVYAEELSEFDMRDVRSALRELAREPKSDFQTAFPDLGTLIIRIRRAWKQRSVVGEYVSCGRCFPGGWIYVDVNGKQCDPSQSPSRTMMLCSCKLKWLAASRDAPL
jgi:hypothetical protein